MNNNKSITKLFFENTVSYQIFLLLIFMTTLSSPMFAEFDLQAYTTASKNITTSPKCLISPPYREKRNLITFQNVKQCLIARVEFLFGISPDLASKRCYKVQKSIILSIASFQSRNKQNPIKHIDNNIIFNPTSPLRRATISVEKVTLFCNYVSNGDLSKDGIIYCKYHGAEIGSKAYKRYQKQIENSNTGIRPDDIVDIAISLPLLLFPVITWLILMKVLSSTKKKTDTLE